ncbi:MAG: hypothetical protein B7Z14_09110 [Bosea sp. 32-68-6]|nr:MAG: hypothetical protein B7Z14_09110 [Bosea sp. 32-68-6]
MMTSLSPTALILRSARHERVSKDAPEGDGASGSILRDAAEFILGPAIGRTRGRLLRMRAGESRRMTRAA